MSSPTVVMFSKSNLQLGGFDNHYVWMVDWEMWIRQLQVNDCYFVPEPLCFKRVDSNQLTRQVYKNFLHLFEEYNFCRDLLMSGQPDLNRTRAQLKTIVKRKVVEIWSLVAKVRFKLNKKDNQRLFRNSR